MPENHPCRLLRAGFFTLVCANLSAHGHALSSGDDVPFPGLVLGCLVVLAAAWAAAGQRHGPVSLLAWSAWAQLALHISFSWAQSRGGAHPHTADALTHTHGPAWAMFALHGAGTLVSAWWLYRGERACFALLHSTARWVPPLLPVLLTDTAPPMPQRPAGRRPTYRGLRPRGAHPGWSLLVRGPPRPAATA